MMFINMWRFCSVSFSVWNWKKLSLKHTNVDPLQTTLFRSHSNYTVIISGGINDNSTELISDIDVDNVFQQFISFSNLCGTASSVMIFYSSSS